MSLSSPQLCLQTVATSNAPIQNDLKEHIVNMCMNSSSLLSKPRPPPPSAQLGIRPPPVTAAVAATSRGLGSIGDPSSNLRSSKGFLPSANTTGIEPLVGLTSQVGNSIIALPLVSSPLSAATPRSIQIKE